MRTLGQHCAKWLIGYGYHCFYAFLWLAGLFTVTALAAVFWLGPERYIVPGPAAGTPAVAAAGLAVPATPSPPASASRQPGGVPVRAGQPGGVPVRHGLPVPRPGRVRCACRHGGTGPDGSGRERVLRSGPDRLRDRARLSPHQPEQQRVRPVRRPRHRGRAGGGPARLGGPGRGRHPARRVHPGADRGHPQPARRGLTGGLRVPRPHALGSGPWPTASW